MQAAEQKALFLVAMLLLSIMPLAAHTQIVQQPVLPESRVRGLSVGNAAGIGGCSCVASTLHWGSGHVYDRAPVGRLDGLDYFGARYMSSAQGRFTSPDPLLNSGRPWDPQSWNRYSYTLNNPLRYSDPTGLYEWDATLGGGCADKALRGGSCSGFTKQQGKDIASERKNIRKQLNKLDKSKDAALHGAAGAIGKENVDNGVTIGMGAVTPGAVAQVSTTRPLTIDANGNPELDLTVLPGAKGDSLFISLAHEGTHVADAQSVAGGAPMMTHMDTELHGYGASVAAAQRLGWPSAGATVGTTPFVFWSSSWSKVDQQTRPPQEIRNFLQVSPIYAPKLNQSAYQK